MRSSAELPSPFGVLPRELWTSCYPVDFRQAEGRDIFRNMAFDDHGVPRYRFGRRRNWNEIGEQYNQVHIAWWAIRCLQRWRIENDPACEPTFWSQVGWMAAHARRLPSGAVTWEVPYPYIEGFTRVNPPWIGGQGLGVIASVLVRAERLRPGEGFGDLAKGAGTLLLTPREEGGVRRLVEGQVYYEIREADPPSRFLDCLAFSLLGLWDLWEWTGDPRFRDGFDAGVFTIRTHLPYWDFHGFWSRMGILRIPCSPFYQKLTVSTLDAVATLAGDEKLKGKAGSWNPHGRSPTQVFLCLSAATLGMLRYRLASRDLWKAEGSAPGVLKG